MKVLFLCNKSPWPPKEGGSMAMNMLIEGLADAGHEVKVLAVNSHKYNISREDIPEPFVQKTGLELIDVDLRIRPVPALYNLLTGRSYHVSRFISRKFSKRLAALLQSDSFDIVQIETLYMCPYIPVIRKYSHAAIVLRAHNIEHLLWDRIASETKNLLKKWYIRCLAGALRRFEEHAVLQCNGIAAITPKDEEYFRKAVSRNQAPGGGHPAPSSAIPVISLPFGIKTAGYSSPKEGIEFPSLFSIGAMNWLPNEEGIRWFLGKVWPDLHMQFPEMKYYLAGRAMPSWMLNLSQPGVIVEGEVPDAAGFMATKALMIVPLFSGSGIRIKIIEAMAAGKTVISTSLGAEGIACTDRENILLADSPCEFYEMISACVKDRSTSDRIGENARNLIETQYRPEAIIGKLHAFYQLILG